MKLAKLRPGVAMVMLMVGLSLASTGLLLWLAPHGPDSRSWHLLGLLRHQYKEIHQLLGLTFISAMVLHLLLNLPALRSYCRLKKGPLWHHPLLWSVLLVIIVVVLALL